MKFLIICLNSFLFAQNVYYAKANNETDNEKKVCKELSQIYSLGVVRAINNYTPQDGDATYDLLKKYKSVLKRCNKAVKNIGDYNQQRIYNYCLSLYLVCAKDSYGHELVYSKVPDLGEMIKTGQPPTKCLGKYLSKADDGREAKITKHKVTGAYQNTNPKTYSRNGEILFIPKDINCKSYESYKTLAQIYQMLIESKHHVTKNKTHESYHIDNYKEEYEWSDKTRDKIKELFDSQ